MINQKQISQCYCGCHQRYNPNLCTICIETNCNVKYDNTKEVRKGMIQCMVGLSITFFGFALFFIIFTPVYEVGLILILMFAPMLVIGIVKIEGQSKTDLEEKV